MSSYKNLVVVHQPDFMPWMGFFQKLLKADTFVLLDHVTNHPKARNWLRRVRILVNREPQWVSVPLRDDPTESFVPIHRLEIQTDHSAFQKNLPDTFVQNYRRAPFFTETIGLVNQYFSAAGPVSLLQRNMQFIEAVVAGMGARMPPIVRSSNLSCTQSRTAMLVEVAQQVTADAFLLSGGVSDYFEPELFAAAGIALVPQAFTHPTYEHFNRKEFVPGLSIIDPLMNCGFAGTYAMLRS